MKNLFVIIFAFLVCQANAFRPILLLGNQNLIERTCKQTPFYDLCIWSLKSNPESRDASVKKLAQIMVDSLKTKATETLDLIDELLQDGLALDPEMQKALTSCAERYNVIIRGDVPEINEALKTGDYKFAAKGANDAAIEANSCEIEFSTKSPLTDMNKVVHDVSVVAASIVKIIQTKFSF
ncbi:hypothetical protein ERO13_A05G275500v2 [Gossypium hirsutum]|uniref:Pectinesterase inhibitor domain-containing protein n=3 Tax=Gossypium TaxID=3633 RepID=A0A5J5VU55_GOSBA|nr:hypothetical protein ES319_A05G287600v1 [Gossypium barbadense]KAG4201382.1 hypothetical protein ERO13_A05G275500v2 [Gossypium hirsutum]TYH18766.1 hypothetical protein ES288_A05G299700v1 [Gossypium darwinii]TYI29254.1 hypothetical protein ES332_A05G303600v1 [Gossypium tomentosum]